VRAEEAARSVLRRPSPGDGAFTLNCHFSRRLPVCRLETTVPKYIDDHAGNLRTTQPRLMEVPLESFH